ncbi:MAG TPA: beta-galactosidase, partial [Chloroflexota bacterium]|nr:beta-galactosidase [Chloroflexota bacterium]
LGVHGRMTDEVEQWKMERTVDMIDAMGAEWLVEYFPWAYLEPTKGVFDWGHADLVIRSAAARGLKVIARLDMVPDWARPEGSPSRLLTEDRYSDYAEFAAAFAARYRGLVDDMVVWNEPNLSFEWGYRPVDPVSYTKLLKTSYLAIKAANPEVSVVAAGLASTLDNSDSALSDLVYLQRMYDAGAAPYFDKLAVHSYGWRSPPDDPAAPDRINFARTELVRQVMVDNGDAGKKIAITESGWNDHPRWTKAVRPTQRIQYSLRAAEKVAAEWPWVESISFWSFRLPKDARNYNDNFTFVSVDFRPKAIYEAFKERSEKLTGAGGTVARGSE